MSHLRSVVFDRAHAAKKLQYRRAVNKLVATAFIPKIASSDVTVAFEGALVIVTAHEQHAELMVKAVVASVARRLACGRIEARARQALRSSLARLPARQVSSRRLRYRR